MRRNVVLLAALLVALIAGVLSFALRATPDAADVGAADDAGTTRATERVDPRDDEGRRPFRFAWFDDGDPDARGRAGVRRGRRFRDGGVRRGRRARRRRELSEGERQARREARLARFRERVEVVALGPSEPEIGAGELFRPFRQARRATRDCLVQAGQRARRSWRDSRSQDREIVFDLNSEGAFVPGSFGATPPLPEALSLCFEQGLSGVASESAPGADGARVVMRLPARQGRPDSGAGDGRGAGP